MRNLYFFLGALLLVDGVFGDDVTLSVMEGDSVTLKPHPELKQGDSAQWLYGEERIAEMNKVVKDVDERFKGKLNLNQTTGSLTITNIRTDHAGGYKLHISGDIEPPDRIFSVTVRDNVVSVSVLEGDTVTLHTGVTGIQKADLKGPDGATWSNRNTETGEITIRNIQRNQSGDYELKINTSSMILHRELRIIISGKVKTETVKEGETAILNTNLILQKNDLIMWKFKGNLIPEINTGTNSRQYVDRQTGSLIIIKSRTTDTGDYHLNISSSSHTIKRTISVTVSSGLSSGVIAGIAVGVLLVFAAAAAGVIYHRRNNSELQRRRERY